MDKKSNKRYYAIKEGKGVKNIILNTWSECKPLVIGYNAVYKSFKTRKDAEDYLNRITPKQVEKTKKVTVKAIQQKRKQKAGTVSVQTRIPKELYEKFLNRCRVMQLDNKKTLQGLIQESFEEWTDD